MVAVHSDLCRRGYRALNGQVWASRCGRIVSEAPISPRQALDGMRGINNHGGRSGPERGALRGCWCGLRYTGQADPGCYRCRTPHGRERQRTEGACTRLLSAPPPFPTAGSRSRGCGGAGARGFPPPKPPPSDLQAEKMTIKRKKEGRRPCAGVPTSAGCETDGPDRGISAREPANLAG